MSNPYSKAKLSFILIVLFCFVSSINAQTPANKANKTTPPANSKTSDAKKQAFNTKNIKARGIIAADMDCLVKINGSNKVVNVKAYTASVVSLPFGVNTIEASTIDKTFSSTYRTTVDVKDSSRQIIDISFFDDKRFLDYIKFGNYKMVETAIKKNADLAPNTDQVLPTSPLLLAITSSQPEIVKLLLDKGASFTSPDNIYPLHKAAVFASGQITKKGELPDDRKIIDVFLAKGCKLTDKDEGGNTLLHAAARGMKFELVQWLVEQGLDVNAKNDADQTALDIAEDKGSVSIISYLSSKMPHKEEKETEEK